MTRRQAPEAAIDPEAAANGRRVAARDPDLPEPFAANLPPGVVAIGQALHELAETLPALRAIIELHARPAESPVAYRKEQAARLLGVSPRLIERLLAAGRFPRPDAYAGRCPLWTRATLEGWIRQGGGQI
jgi:hypothetical protein